MSENLFRWFLFRILIGLAPICINALAIALEGRGFSIYALTSRGEPLLIICAICAGALGELLASEKLYPKRRLLAGWGCAATLLMAAAGYGLLMSLVAKAGTYPSSSYDYRVASHYSILVYLIGVASSFGCVVLAELAKQKE